MTERFVHRRQSNQDPVPSTSRGISHKHRSQRNPKAQPTVNGSRKAYRLVDSDSSDIENDDVNIPKHSASRSTLKKRGVKFSSKGRNLPDDFDSDDEDVIPVKCRKKPRIVSESESDDNDSDIPVKRTKCLRNKNAVLESEDSESDEDVIPKFKSKKCRLMNFSDDNREYTPDRNTSSNMNGNSSRSASRPRSASRQFEDSGRARSRSRRERPRRLERYFLDDEANRRVSSEDWSNGSGSEWETNWERDWEEHWQDVERSPNRANGDSNVQAASGEESKTEGKASKGKEEKSAENTASNEDSKDSCPICLLDFTDQKLGTPASCDHVYCLDCLLEWCKVINTCPADRKEFLSIHVRKHLGGDVVETLPVQDRTQNADGSADDSTSCEVCGRTDGEDTMLLCDNCDLGFHMDCLNPPLTEVPADEWLCPDCSISGVIPGIGVNFLTLFSVFNEIFGEGGELSGVVSPFANMLGPNFFERDGGDLSPIPRGHGFRWEGHLSPVEEREVRRSQRRSQRRRRRTSNSQGIEEHPTRSPRTSRERRERRERRGNPSNAAEARPSSSGTRHRQRSSNSSRSPRHVPSSFFPRRPSSQGPSSSGNVSSPRRPQTQGNSSSPRDRHFNRSLRRHTHTNFRNARPRTSSSSENTTIRLHRRRWLDTSSSDE